VSEEELRKNDILFQIDMQLYDEFNDKLCEMDEHLGDIYSLRDIEEVKQAEKEKERELLREAIKKLQKENEALGRTLDDEIADNDRLQENNLSYQEELAKAWKENAELKEQKDNAIKLRNEIIEEEKELKEEIDNLIKENHKHIDYIADMKKKHEDKIRTKIKELEDKCEAIKKEYTGTYALTGNYLEAFYQIVILKELLGDDE